MLNKKLAEMNENGTLPIFKNYLANISANPTKVKSLSDFAEDGWYEVIDVDGFEKYLVYHYAEGKKISVRYIFGKTPKIQEANPKGFFGEIADVISVFAYDSTLSVSKLNTEEGSAVKLIGYDTEGNLVEDDIPEGIVVDDALNTESDNAIANAPVAIALNKKANTSDLLDGTLIPNKALQAKSIEAVSTESGAVQDTPFIYQGTGTANGTSIADTSPVGKHLEKQGNSVVVNQLIQNADFAGASGWYSSSSTTLSISSGIATIGKVSATANAEIYRGLPELVIANHKYLAIVRAKTPAAIVRVVIDKDNWASSYGASATITPNQWTTLAMIITATSSPTSSNNLHIYPLPETEDDAQAEIDYCYLIDLTQWFAGNIPQDLLDHPENFFRYYNGSLAYNAGSMENGTGRYLTCGGRNVWDEQWEIGTYSNSDGSKISQSNCIRNKNYIDIVPNGEYYIKTSTSVRLYFYDSNKNFIEYYDWIGNTNFKVPANAYYMNFRIGDQYGTTYNNDITISLYYTTGDSYDKYFPYEEPKVYDTGSETLLSAGSIRDVKLPDGTITRKVGVVDLGTLNWYMSSGGAVEQTFYATLPDASVDDTYDQKCIIGANYTYDRKSLAQMDDKTYRVAGSTVRICDTAYTDAASFKAAMSGVILNYELAEPTTEQGTPFAENIEINDYGTMGWDSEVPQGCKIFYPADYALFIDSLGEKFNWDVDDIVSQAELTAVDNKIGAKLPECPTDTDGTYVLKATVADGVVTYTWVAE